MLAMEYIDVIKFLYKDKGLKYAEIAREIKHDPRTIKKYVEKEDFNYQPITTCEKKSILEPFKEVIISWIKEDKNSRRKQRHTAKRVFDRLNEEYPTEFTASYRTVAYYVAQVKKEIYSEDQGYLPLDHYPEEAQVDFGEADFVENGITYNGYYVNISFPHSNAGYLQLFKGANQQCLLEGLKNIFEHMKCVPKRIWFDNDKAIVKKIREHGKRDVSEGFLRFQLHYGFKSNFCNPDSGHEKGSVEAKVGYHRRNFLVPIPKFRDIKAFNINLLRKCDADMDRPHYIKNAKINQLFSEAKQQMLPLPRQPYEIYKYETASSDKYGKIRFDNRIYSTSPAYASRQVIVKAGAYEVIILDEDYREIQSHQRLYGDNKESMKSEPYLDLMSKRPTAMKYTGLFKNLPQSLQKYFETCQYEEKKAALRLLKKMVTNHDINIATKAFELSIEKGVPDIDSIWTVYYTMTNKVIHIEDIKLSNTIPKLNPITIDNQRYDRLLKGGDENARTD